jgi:hypothetical protein
VADTRALSHVSADALDEALVAALAHALCSNPEGGLRSTKRARLKRHRDAIVALRAKHWSWEQIAAMLTAVGFDISPRTLRSEMTAPKKSDRKRASRAAVGDSESVAPQLMAKPKHEKTRESAPASVIESPPPRQRDYQLTKQRSTESGFFTIDMEDN